MAAPPTPWSRGSDRRVLRLDALVAALARRYSASWVALDRVIEAVRRDAPGMRVVHGRHLYRVATDHGGYELSTPGAADPAPSALGAAMHDAVMAGCRAERRLLRARKRLFEALGTRFVDAAEEDGLGPYCEVVVGAWGTLVELPHHRLVRFVDPDGRVRWVAATGAVLRIGAAS